VHARGERRRLSVSTAGTPAWYAIIDGARDPRLHGLVSSCASHMSLFKGKLDPGLYAVSPWLVRIDEREALLSTWQQHGRGESWGIMLLSPLKIEQLQRHFRRFLQAKLPDGTIALFRFYDPRVFNTYIRAAAPEERAPWFEGVMQYGAEAAGGQGMYQYRLDEGGRLHDGNQIIG
jgi:hypothetical protein